MAELKYEKYFMKDTGFKPRPASERLFGKFEVPKLHHILGTSNLPNGRSSVLIGLKPLSFMKYLSYFNSAIFLLFS